MQRIDLRLAFRLPMAPEGALGHLGATAVPGCEEVRQGWYRRSLDLPSGPGVIALSPRPDHMACRLYLTDLRDLAAATARARRLVDLDADPEAIDSALAADGALAPLVAKQPGQRIPRTVDDHEMALRAVLGQQVSTAAARTLAARLAAAHGTPIDDPEGGSLTHVFPPAAVLAAMDPDELRLPARRRLSFLTLAGALAGGEIDLGPGADRDQARAGLARLPGLGPWTIEIVAMRALGDPDAFPVSDLGLRRAAAAAGLPDQVKSLTAHAETWRPWRSYAVQYLWSSLDHPINRWSLTSGDSPTNQMEVA